MTLQKANLILSLCVCGLLGGLIALILVEKPAEKNPVNETGNGYEQNVITVQTQKAIPGDSFSIPREYSGILRSARSVDLGFSRAGRIVAISGEVGDKVDKGDRLARLDIRRLELQKEAYEDALDTPRDRQAPPTGKVVTQADLDLVNLDLEDSELTAPFDAIITSRMMEVGAMASPGHPVFRLIERSHLEALVSLPADVADGMKKDDPHPLLVGDVSIPAEVEAVLPEVDLTTRTRSVVFSIDEETSKLVSPGAIVRLRLEREETSSGYWLPLSAMTREIRGLWSVFAVEKDEEGQNRVVRKYLELVHVEGNRARVRGTDSRAFEYIVKGVHRVVPGQRVRLAGESPSGGEEEEPEAGTEAP